MFRQGTMTRVRAGVCLVLILAALAAFSPCQAAAPSAWELHMKEGLNALRELRYGDTEREFRAALAESEKFGADDLRNATSLSNLGVLLESRGEWQKAEPLYSQSLKIKQSALGPFSVEAIDNSARMCQFYLRRKMYDKADPLSQQIMEFGDRQVADVGTMQKSFEQLSEFYEHHKEFAKARELLIQAPQLTRGDVKNNDLELAVLLDRVSAANKSRASVSGRFPDCERMYKQALTLRTRVLSGKHLALSAAYANLGSLYVDEKRFDLAEPLLNKAFSVSRDTIGFSKPQTYTRMDEWARSLIALGRYSQAEELYRRALAQFIANYGTASGYTANVELGLADLLELRGNNHEAASLVGRALRIREGQFGPQHVALADLLDRYAGLLAKTNHAREAARYQARANHIRG